MRVSFAALLTDRKLIGDWTSLITAVAHIMSAESGTVIYTGTGFHGYGKLVVVEHNNEWATLYAHMDKITV